MKKLTTLLLALSLIIAMATLSSCDMVKQYLPEIDLEGSTGEENNDETIDNGGNTTEDNEQLPISEDEWIAAMSVTNYSYEHTSYNAYHGPFDENGQAITVIEKLACTDAAKSIDTSEYKDCVEWYIIPIDGKSIELYLSEEGGEYVAYDFGSEYTVETLFESGMSLGGEQDLTEHYKNLKYVGSDTYKAEYILPDGSKLSYEVVIKNGKVEQLIASRASTDGNLKDDMRFYDIGSTVVNVPEYTFDEDKSFPLSSEEFMQLIASTNYTVNTDYKKTNDDGTVEITASSLIKHSGTDEYHYYDWGTYTQHRYYTKIEDQVYLIDNEDTDGNYLAYTTQYELEPIMLARSLPLAPDAVDSFVYDASTSTYKYESANGIVEFQFSDSGVEKIVFNATSGVMTITDIGTTVVELPEFTFAE